MENQNKIYTLYSPLISDVVLMENNSPSHIKLVKFYPEASTLAHQKQKTFCYRI